MLTDGWTDGRNLEAGPLAVQDQGLEPGQDGPTQNLQTGSALASLCRRFLHHLGRRRGGGGERARGGGEVEGVEKTVRGHLSSALSQKNGCGFFLQSTLSSDKKIYIY